MPESDESLKCHPKKAKTAAAIQAQKSNCGTAAGAARGERGSIALRIRRMEKDKADAVLDAPIQGGMGIRKTLQFAPEGTALAEHKNALQTGRRQEEYFGL